MVAGVDAVYGEIARPDDVLGRLGGAAGAAHGASYNPEHAFEFGLQRVRDGIDVPVRERAAPAL